MSRIASILSALLLLAGCEDSPTSNREAFPAKVELEPTRTLAFYGRVNDWLWIDEAVLLEEISALSKAGWDGYLIEMGGSSWLGDVSEEEARARIAERYPALVDALADNGMLLLNSIQNDNAGEGKYGSKEPPLSKQAAFSAWLVSLVAAVGRPDVVLVQPCAETKTSAGRELERLCAKELSEFCLVSNPNRGEKSADGGKWADYKAVHPWSVESISKADIVVSDTGKIISELDADGNMEGAQNPQRVLKFLQACEAKGVMLAGDYVFNQAGAIDRATIEGIP